MKAAREAEKIKKNEDRPDYAGEHFNSNSGRVCC
jgi:hypothetical protein